MPHIKGIAVNFRFGSRGYPEPAEDIELLQGSIYSILKTKQGERVRRPTFGCDLDRLLFTNMTQAAKVRAQTTARLAIRRQEKRVIVDNITIRPDDAQGNKINLLIVWRPVSNQAARQTTTISFGG